MLLCFCLPAGSKTLTHFKKTSTRSQKSASNKKTTGVSPIRALPPAAGCYDINWATWGGSPGNVVSSATGVINDGIENINITMASQDYSFGFTPNIYTLSRLSGYPSPIPDRTVPKTTWSNGSNNVSGKTVMSFSKTVTNPVLLLASLGASDGTQAKLTFSLPYVVVYDGGHMVYNDDHSITGTEGYAVIMFPGEFNSVTINSTTYENYTNITWGLKPQPFPVSITENSNSCGSTSLTASGGTAYKWNGGDTPTSATNTFHTSGTYVVTVTSADGCTASTSKTINVQTLSGAGVTGNTVGCGSVTLTASGGDTYLWDGGDTPTSATNTFHTSGNYSVTVTSANGCTGIVTKTVDVQPPLVANISGEPVACGSVTLTASGGDTYLWNGGDTTNSATNTFHTSGTYTLTVTNSNGCTASISKNVTVLRELSAGITGNPNVCDYIVLRAVGGDNYLWDGGDTPTSDVNTFHTSGTYTVIVSNLAGCSTPVSKTITVMPLPVPTITGNASGCGSVTLTAGGGATYIWDGGDTPNNAANTFHTSGTYTATVFNSDGCFALISKTITVLPAVTPVITGNTNGCGSVTLTASGGTTYLWSGGDTPNAATNTFHTSGNYTVQVTNTAGCNNTASANVIINTPATAQVSITAMPAGIICAGTPVTFTPVITNGGPDPDVLWYKNNAYITTAAAYQTASLANQDVISCKVNSTLPCTPAGATSNAITMTVNAAPTVYFDHDLQVTDNNPVVLNPIIGGTPAQYIWTPTTGLSSASVANPTANPLITTTYHLKVVNAAGCDAGADVTVKVDRPLVIPNTFTPNGDGVNDTWKITDIDLLPDVTVNIYNRWGTPVFHSIGYGIPWDGTYNGKPVPTGTYYFLINTSDERFKTISGNLTVLR